MNINPTYKAYLVGINNYTQNNISRLVTPKDDALVLDSVLREVYSYETAVLVGTVTKDQIIELFENLRANKAKTDECLIIYFAGHGFARDGEEGQMEGYLLPSDANLEDEESLVSMRWLYECLKENNPHHLLVILDCCFAGAFRWAPSHRGFQKSKELTNEQFWYFQQHQSWQVITSASYDEKALDILSGNRARETHLEKVHSPFAYALINGLKGDADLVPNGGDGVITASELIVYLQQSFISFLEPDSHLQMPELWTLNMSHKGQYLFQVKPELDLPTAPPLTEENNPYRGLKSYEESHQDLFFGRDDVIKSLETQVRNNKLVVVIGASGSGKSSLVKAGLIPIFRQENDWEVFPTMRPGRDPFKSFRQLGGMYLNQDLSPKFTPIDIVKLLPNKKFVWVIDQTEELITQIDAPEKRDTFLSELNTILTDFPNFHIIMTLRADFEPQFVQTALEDYWSSARFFIPKMTTRELRQAVLGPAEAKSIFFDPPELIDEIINEVVDSPGSLPLLSFVLSELYYLCIEKEHQSRTILQQDYDTFNGVVGAIGIKANQVYDNLPNDQYRASMQNLMLRMISLEGGERSRRRVFNKELKFNESEETKRMEAVVEKLEQARLIVSDKDAEENSFIEPAHDELIRGWERLQIWLEDFGQENLLLLQGVNQASLEWSKESKGKGLLWTTNPKLREALNLMEYQDWFSKIGHFFRRNQVK